MSTPTLPSETLDFNGAMLDALNSSDIRIRREATRIADRVDRMAARQNVINEKARAAAAVNELAALEARVAELRSFVKAAAKPKRSYKAKPNPTQCACGRWFTTAQGAAGHRNIGLCKGAPVGSGVA